MNVTTALALSKLFIERMTICWYFGNQYNTDSALHISVAPDTSRTSTCINPDLTPRLLFQGCIKDIVRIVRNHYIMLQMCKDRIHQEIED